MKEYWKTKLMKDLLKIEKDGEGGTITMDYIHYQENMLRLVSKAYEDGWNAAILKDDAIHARDDAKRGQEE